MWGPGWVARELWRGRVAVARGGRIPVLRGLLRRRHPGSVHDGGWGEVLGRGGVLGRLGWHHLQIFTQIRHFFIYHMGHSMGKPNT